MRQPRPAPRWRRRVSVARGDQITFRSMVAIYGRTTLPRGLARSAAETGDNDSSRSEGMKRHLPGCTAGRHHRAASGAPPRLVRARSAVTAAPNTSGGPGGIGVERIIVRYRALHALALPAHGRPGRPVGRCRRPRVPLDFVGVTFGRLGFVDCRLAAAKSGLAPVAPGDALMGIAALARAVVLVADGWSACGDVIRRATRP
jgi:hypothetical protein